MSFTASKKKSEAVGLVLIDNRLIDQMVSYEVTTLLRRTGYVGGLDVVLDSGGGYLDVAYAKDTGYVRPSPWGRACCP